MASTKKLLKQFMQQLMGLFSQRFGEQSALLQRIEQHLSFIFDPDFTGFAPGEEVALRTSAREGLAAQQQAAATQFRSQSLTLGGRQIPSGVQAAIEAGIGTSFAQEQASAQRDITALGGQRRLGAILSAAGILQGNASLLDSLGFANAATGAAGALSQFRGNPLLQSILGGAFGAAGSFLTKFCHISEALYGPVVAHRMRQYLLTHATPDFLTWYAQAGPALAVLARRDLVVAALLKLHFDPLREAAQEAHDAQTRGAGGCAGAL